MNVWIVELTEPLPFESGGRMMRCGQLAQMLAAGGHDVVWWSSDFSHIQKAYRHPQEDALSVQSNYRIELLGGPGYRNNVSLARVRSHRARAAAFDRLAPHRPAPDVILSAMPTPEVCEAVLNYARPRSLPVVIDIRDTWPDAFVPLFPRLVRPLARLVLTPEFRRIRRICAQSTALFSVSQQYLDWGLHCADRVQQALDRVFYLGYDPTLPSPSPKDADFLDEAGISSEHFVVAFIGAFGVTYDLATVIRAARRAHNEGDHHLVFVLAGDGPRSREWREMATALPNVKFPGWLSQNQIAALLRRANVGLAAYCAAAPQSLPNKPFEYFAGGMPVVSSLTGDLQTLLAAERIGMTYRADDSDDLLFCLRTLANSADLACEMGSNARSIAEQRFAVPRIIASMISHLEVIVDQHSSRLAVHGLSCKAVGVADSDLKASK
jgi:glycosyltransferase involved in cell wall biosynthesis